MGIEVLWVEMHDDLIGYVLSANRLQQALGVCRFRVADEHDLIRFAEIKIERIEHGPEPKGLLFHLLGIESQDALRTL